MPMHRSAWTSKSKPQIPNCLNKQIKTPNTNAQMIARINAHCCLCVFLFLVKSTTRYKQASDWFHTSLRMQPFFSNSIKKTSTKNNILVTRCKVLLTYFILSLFVCMPIRLIQQKEKDKTWWRCVCWAEESCERTLIISSQKLLGSKGPSKSCSFTTTMSNWVTGSSFIKERVTGSFDPIEIHPSTMHELQNIFDILDYHKQIQMKANHNPIQ